MSEGEVNWRERYEKEKWKRKKVEYMLQKQIKAYTSYHKRMLKIFGEESKSE